jgi:hypothetical protein
MDNKTEICQEKGWEYLNEMRGEIVFDDDIDDYEDEDE